MVANGMNKLYRQYNAYDENEANARYVLVYLNTMLFFYKNNHKTIPKNEFARVLETIQSLPPDNKLLSQLIHSLISINDLSIQRGADKGRSVILIEEAISKLPDSVFEQLSESEASPTALFIQQTLRKPIKLTSGKVDLLEVLEKLKKSVHESEGFYTKDIDESFLKYVQSQLEAISAGKEYDHLLLRNLFIEYGKGRIGENELKVIVGFLYKQSIDKEKFCQSFLKNYQDAYDSFARKQNGKNVLLENLGRFLPLLNEPLLSGQLEKIMSAVNFKLEDPQASESDEAYTLYKIIISFYSDETLQVENTHEEKEFLRFLLGESLYSCLQQQGKEIADIPLSGSKVFSELPVLMHHALLTQDTQVQKKFEELVSLFIRVNDNAPEHQQRNIGLFFFKFQSEIEQIMKTMGAEGVTYLRNHLAGTVLNLERTLESLVILPEELQSKLGEYFKKAHLTNKEHPEEIKAFKTCMIVLGALINLRAHGEYEEDPAIIAQFYMEMAKDKSPQEFLLVLSQMLLEKILLESEGLQLKPQQINEIFERIEVTRFVQLAAASQHMRQDPYREVYLNLLTLDLLGGDVDDFLHNREQENRLGQSLAEHNGRIRETLEKNGISPKTALKYDRHYDFIVTSGEETHLNKGNQLVVLWSYLNKLKEQIIALDQTTISNEKNKTRIAAILKNIEKIEVLIHKNEGADTNFAIINVLEMPVAQDLIKKIKSNLVALKESKAATPSTFNEFAEHVLMQAEHIEKAKEINLKKEQSSKMSINYFSVEQWRKEKLMTFFLGDEVGCCLATTSTQFQAMVQRRMDDSLLFHVAVDKVTGRSAALIWLYLAQTKEGKIVLMANFFEVNTKYAVNETVRVALLNGLLKFTEQYCKDNPGISGFYMNRLSYGWNIRDLDSYPVVEFKPGDKLGGPFIPGVSADQIDLSDKDVREQMELLTKQKYYLVSLYNENFHQFSPDVLSKNMKPHQIEKEMILEKAVLAIAKDEKNIEKIITAIAAQHFLELSPFYNFPLEKNEAFIEDINKIYKRVMLSNVPVGETATLRFFPEFSNSTKENPSNPLEPKV